MTEKAKCTSTLQRTWSVLFAVLLCATTSSSASTPECGERVSLAKLIANPDTYHGKTLWVVANVTIEFENMTACPSGVEVEMKKCLWLDIDDGPYKTDQDYARYQSKLRTWTRFNRETVAIRAMFDKTLTGHFGMWPGGLRRVTEMSGRDSGWSFASDATMPRTVCLSIPAR